MDISLLITTYNWKEALAVVLETALHQNLAPFEIIIGDDGSRPDTAELVQSFVQRSSIPLRHIWHEDLGFRAAKIRNRAIAAARGDYIVMIDGDMLLHPQFIADHMQAARSGFFVQGGRIQAGVEQSTRLLKTPLYRPKLFSADIRNRKNTINSRVLARLFSYASKRLSGIRTCNLAAWRADIIQINGFDEAYVGWGREDSDFALRLINAGVKRWDLKFNANAVHLNHPDNSRDNLSANDLRLLAAQEQGLIRCQAGIDQFL